MLAGAAPEILGNDPRLFGKLLAAAARLGVAHHPAIDLALANPLPNPAPTSLLVSLAKYLGTNDRILQVFAPPENAAVLQTALRDGDRGVLDIRRLGILRNCRPQSTTQLARRGASGG